MKKLFIFLSLFTVVSLLLNIFLLYDRIAPKQTAFQVIGVIDGDTFKIKSNNEERRVRLMGVDTPEIGKCLHNEARNKLIELVLGKEVVLKDQFSDPYGRIMANVFSNNIYINKEILVSGLGRMEYYENPHRDELKKAYEEARIKNTGIFSGICISKIPPVSSITSLPCNIKGNIDENLQKKIYYLPSCRNYSQVEIDLSTDDQWFCTETEAAEAGFEKSKTCQI